MAGPIKSVLLLDYESLHRSLLGAAGDTRLADRAAAWIAAIESGRLIGPEGTRRQLMVKRCYAGSSVRGKQRDVLTAAGFEVIDAADAGARSSADLHMAMDTIDALGRHEAYQEFILLSAASELAPLLTRLKASKRLTTIYADAATPESDKALADALLESADFARFLTSADMPASEIRVPTGGNDRADIEAFARKIHAATNIPLFSPKSFAELFRHLTDEIAANGYHFQTTAKNVADRMVASGRNVTRRQVVFIVKGLALKGHVFSTSDTPERLAEVFREQAHYLITNAGISLDVHQQELLSAWFMSRAPASADILTSAASAAGVPPETKQTIEDTIDREVASAAIRPPAPERPKASARPTASTKPPAVKPVDMPKSTARMTPQAKPGPSPSAREEAKAVIAARIAASAKLKAGSRAPIPAKAAPKPPAAPRAEEPAPASEAAAASMRRAKQDTDALENSILAAIAEAVDVLVEDSTDDEHPSREPPAKKKATNGPRQEERPLPPPSAVEEDPESGDIGDQIQRIIATYTRNRTGD